MMVTFVSQCEKKALARSRRVLDAFADRIGDNTWQTVITQEGLLAVKKLLRKTASKNTAVSCHWIRSRSRSELVWVVGNRNKFDEDGRVPATVHRHALTVPTVQLRQNGQERVAVIAQLAREFGLRFKEASVLDANRAIKQANRLGRINITQGTKGGRGKGSDRWVPINDNNLAALKQAAEIQNNERNLVPPNINYVQWRDHAYNQWHSATKNTAINGFHDMRAAYACERYRAITGHPAPVFAGERQAGKTLDTQARTIISQELGHNRPDVIAAYVGSGK